jgi:hypothetical protein
MTDHTKKTTFVGFVNVCEDGKYWMDGHWEHGTDAPTLFRYNTREEKLIAQDVAQGYIDNWGVKELELVTFEAKSRQAVKLKKRTDAEKEAERAKILKEAKKARGEDEVEAEAVPVAQENSQEPKKRGRKPKQEC